MVFPYFLATVGGGIVIVLRKSRFIDRHGMQLITMIILIPAILVAWNREWLSRDAGVAILSGIAGYVFGAGSRDQQTQPSN